LISINDLLKIEVALTICYRKHIVNENSANSIIVLDYGVIFTQKSGHPVKLQEVVDNEYANAHLTIIGKEDDYR
jgi:hypothetical protein